MHVYSPLILICICCSSLSGQFNVKVGYGIGVVDAPAVDAMIRQHNTLSENYTSGFEDLNILHNFELGVRNKWRGVSVSFDWRLQRNIFNAEGERSPGGAVFENTMTFGINSLSTGLSFHFGQFSAGSTVDYNFLKVRSVFEEHDYEHTLRDEAVSSHFSLEYTLPGENFVALSFRPFVQVYWTDFDFTPLATAINEDSDPLKEMLFNYGLSLIIYNGRRRP